MAKIPEILTRHVHPAEIINESDSDDVIRQKLEGAVYVINLSPHTMEELSRLVNRPKKKETLSCDEKPIKKYDIF